MRNIINYPINFKNIPLSDRIYLYIHDDLLKDFPIAGINEPLVLIKDTEVKTSPFWLDEVIYTGDEELDYLLNLEAEEMKNYLRKKDTFWILVRQTVKNKLLQANQYFKDRGYELVLKIWYRPLEVQRNLFNKIYDYFCKKNPILSEKDVYDQTIQFIADPNIFVAPHTTWWALDLLLIELSTEREMDMWCPINYIGEEANMTTFNISDQQKKNREFLALWMLKFGFANLASEWWHFSYGDQYWAYFYWKSRSLYAPIDY